MKRSEKGKKYIKELIQKLEKRSRNYKILALICYTIGFLLLIGGTLMLNSRIYFTIVSDNNHIEKTLLYCSNAISLGLLIFAARYTLGLGKSFMAESIRNLDKAHALNYGMFYLEMYSDSIKFEWEDLKETLKDWNIDIGSAFITQNAKDSETPFPNAILKMIQNVIRK